MVAGRYARCVVTVPAAVLAAILGVTPVLAAATWTVQPGGPVSLTSGRLTLKDTSTGATAFAQVGIVQPGLFPASQCGPVTAAGLRVFPPNQTQSKRVPFPFTACSKTGPLYLKIMPVQ